MTLGQIMRLALRQLDEAPEDLSEYDEQFRAYANAGYQTAVSVYLRPRGMRTLRTDGHGCAVIRGMGIRRIISLEHADRRLGGQVLFRLEESGDAIRTVFPKAELTALCEVKYPDMEKDDEEPMIPRSAHAALADYICYRYLSCGSLAKQKRAQNFYAQYLQAMQRIEPDGYRSADRERNLYAATDIRAR